MKNKMIITHSNEWNRIIGSLILDETSNQNFSIKELLKVCDNFLSYIKKYKYLLINEVIMKEISGLKEFKKRFWELVGYGNSKGGQFLEKTYPDNKIHELIGRKTSNENKMIKLQETYPKRVVDIHGNKGGYIVISASRQDLVPLNEKGRIKKLDKINYERNNQLLSFIRANGFSHTPCFGRTYEVDENGNTVSVEERGFIVYNYKYNVSGVEDIVRNIDDLRSFGEKMCKEFKQDNFLFVEAGEYPKWINRMGGVDQVFQKEATINNMVAQYFTSLIKPNKIMTQDGRKTRINYDFIDDELVECFINPHPATRNERIARNAIGELL